MTAVLAQKTELLEQGAGVAPVASKVAGLKGLWKGVPITDDEISEAKTSLFRK